MQAWTHLMWLISSDTDMVTIYLFLAKGGVENMYLGVDINNGIGNSYESFVWEPLMVKVNALKAAT